MSANVVYYRREVPVAGYEIRPGNGLPEIDGEGRPRPKWLLVERTGSARGRRECFPLDENPVLYRDFAALNHDDTEAVLAFANAYGDLGFAETSPQRPQGEVEWHWWFNTNMLRVAVKVWDLIREQNEDELGRLFRWVPTAENQGDGDWVFSSFGHREPETTDSRKRVDFGTGRVRLGPTASPASAKVFDVANAWLRNFINMHLAGSWRSGQGTSAAGGVSPQSIPDPSTGRDVLRDVPRDLLSAMWLQFAVARDVNTDYRSCGVCSRSFVVTPRSDRNKPKKFCSDACTMRDYRRRRDRAISLHGEGLSLKQVVARLKAEGLDTEADSVKKWIKRKG